MIISSENDRQIWIRDINAAASMNKNVFPASSLDETSSFSAELLNKIDQAFHGEEGNNRNEKSNSLTTDNNGNNKTVQQQQQYQIRTNTMAHVCWHRNCSLGRYEYERAFAVRFIR